MENSKKLKITIIGGGLVGSVCACFMAKRGHYVNLYEYRGDIRTMEQVPGRSINLAMSERAKVALRSIGLEDHMVNEHGIAMRGRMIHNLNGTKYPIIYDSRTNQCLYSIERKHLNEVLLTAADKYENVNLQFNYKLINAYLEEGKVRLMQSQTKNIIEVEADLVIGADGAFSTVRKSMMKRQFDFSQTYIEHGYLELCIPPKDNKFAMEQNYLHIWPRGEFMMIALPNQDLSWTVTLFMPFKTFESLESPKHLLEFFRINFPDSIVLLGEERLVKDFFKVKPSPLVSIKCNPYHDGKALIIGDAAHAMVPFYGQGMNAGFEDCSILDELMDEFGTDLKTILAEFTKRRNKDAETICDLAMYNYIEMRDLVNKKSFLWRKKIDDFLYWLLPGFWIPLYNSIIFTRMSYVQCFKNRQWQDKIVSRLLFFFCPVLILFIGLLFFSYHFNLSDIFYAQKLLK